MSSVFGTSLSGYTLWVANYGATCPLMPTGWSDWQFWQDADNGNISGISGGVDTDVFNGTKTQLEGLTLKPATTPTKPPANGTAPTNTPGTGATPNDGSQGGTIGSGTPKTPSTSSPPPCGI
jgi:hypothetical protein